ncbi:FadR/GntR family transcriptional regulator [Microlunatus parietis]|uniref:DNA-binding FadR family transcriptional regulator n=1 Tax=Microlunatus parietis TaxID=682979 RepID=A0A7Y9I285_9ACTN|nr:FCD domain-containing protein [Microlunatus parietis]NYE68913.1 DNA-binding FadR family transcriptional regulator [Microlunatus parietis]
MARPEREPLARRAAAQLLDRVRAGEWELGRKLPGETTLAAELGVGRSTVREAIRDLAGRGVLQPRQGAGVFVTAVDVPEDWDAVLRRAGIRQVIEARIAIEAESAALAAERRTPADVRRLRRALAEREEADRATGNDGVAGLVDADLALHRAVVAAAHNVIMVELYDGFVPRLRQAMIELLRLHPRRRAVDDHPEHAALVAAVIDRDPDAAARLSRAHLDTLKETLA